MEASETSKDIGSGADRELHKGAGGRRISKWGGAHLFVWGVFWLAPMIWCGIFNYVPNFLPLELRIYIRLGTLFTHRANQWSQPYVLVSMAGRSGWLDVDLNDYDDVMVYGYGNRLHRAMSLAVGRTGQNEVLAGIARHIARRHSQLYPDHPTIDKVKFVSAVWKTGESEWLTSPPSRWRVMPYEMLQPDVAKEIATITVPSGLLALRNKTEQKSANAPERFNDASLQKLLQQRPASILNLPFHGHDLTEASLPLIWKQTKVKKLSLSGWNLRRVDTEGISGMKDLQELDVSKCKFEDPSFAWIAGLASLRVLSVNESTIDARAINYLRSVENLERLDVGGTSVGLAVGGSLHAWKKLSELRIQGISGIDEALSRSVVHHSLVLLNVADCDLHSSELSFLQKFPSLKSLNLDGNPLNSGALIAISNLPSLTQLSISKTLLSEQEIRELEKLPNLLNIRTAEKWELLKK